jgi:hypothetical protein
MVEADGLTFPQGLKHAFLLSHLRPG